MYDYSILDDTYCNECGESDWLVLETYASGTEIKYKECEKTIQIDFEEV